MLTAYYKSLSTINQRFRGGGGVNILVGTIVKYKVGELEEELREGFFMQFRKELTGVVQRFSGNKRFLVKLQDGSEKYITLNQLTVVTV